MYYQVYLDVLFLMNFCMDFLVIHFTKSLLKLPKTFGRTCLGSLLGAVGSCLLTLGYGLPFWLKLALSIPGLSLLMVKAAFPKCKAKAFWKRYLVFLGMTFILGGLIVFLQYKIHLRTVLSLALGGGVLWLGIGAWNRFQARKTNLYRVCLYEKGEEIFIQGLYDTGNHLVCPWNGKEAHVVDEASIMPILKKTETGEELPEGFFYIPFSSVGKEGGMLKAKQIEGLKVFREEGELFFEKPILALGKPSLFDGKPYHIILHSETFDQRE